MSQTLRHIQCFSRSGPKVKLAHYKNRLAHLIVSINIWIVLHVVGICKEQEQGETVPCSGNGRLFATFQEIKMIFCV